VGQRYLRTILLRFKFEVGTAVTLLLSCLGLFFTSLTFWWALFWFSLCVAIALGLLFEARCSHQFLSEVRHEILEGSERSADHWPSIFPTMIPRRDAIGYRLRFPSTSPGI
jgi:hypothetical protein